MLSRRTILAILTAAAALFAVRAQAQSIVLVPRGTPERKAILDVVRVPVERRLGIKVIFEVERLAVFGDWAFAEVHPRTEAGGSITAGHDMPEIMFPISTATWSSRCCVATALRGWWCRKPSCQPTSCGKSG